MQSVNALLPGAGFAAESLLAPRQAIVAYLARVALAAPAIERVSLDDALGRVLAQPILADDEYPNAARSAMDGFAVDGRQAPGTFEIVGDVRMGAAPEVVVTDRTAMRIPTGGVLPSGANAVVPIEEARVEKDVVVVSTPVEIGANVIPEGADMHRGEQVLQPGRRITAPQTGALATLGVSQVPVYRRPVIGVISSGDELVEPSARPRRGETRDSNRYAIAASLRAMGAQPRHYPTLRDEADEFESTLAAVLRECDAVAVTGGSSVGERDRLPQAVAKIGEPGIVVHGLRVKPGRPTLFGAAFGKPILGLPGNPTSALFMLEAVAAPIVAALVGAPIGAAMLQARLAAPVKSRPGWTWYIPVTIEHDGGAPAAHPLPLHSYSVGVTAQADGYLIMDERDEEWPAGMLVTIHKFLGG